jgi:predicted enzyme related to lactoylglutathione lyase
VIKRFFETAFSWSLTDFGGAYTAFSNEGLDGGFFVSERVSTTQNGAALVVFYGKSLKETYRRIMSASGIIKEEMFNFLVAEGFILKN